jgi:RsiW-degrading membrane proteinase PrsW (M82 family)
MSTVTLLNIIGWVLLISMWVLSDNIKNYKTRFIIRMIFGGIALVSFIAALSIQIGEQISR